MIEYCTKCVMPATRPDVTMIDGICSGCRSFSERSEIDWVARKNQFLDILHNYRSKSQSNWDCIVPVSGGKDSTYQVIKLLELGVNPLCVCATPCDVSDIGRENLKNLGQLGVDVIEISPNPVVRRKLNLIGLETVGDIQWPEHVSIFTVPAQMAVRFNIPLIIWGENSQNEFGGPAAEAENNTLDRAWLEEFGGLLGLRVTDLISEDISKKDLLPYIYPTDEEINRVGVTGLFLGHFFPWDGFNNAILSTAHGFKSFGSLVEGTLLNYENLDNYVHGIHDYFKFLKFGFGRATDHACLMIRRGKLDRATALNLVRKYDGNYPATYLGKDLELILKRIQISTSYFDELCDQFANRELFKLNANGNLLRDERGNLVKVNYDN